MSSYLVWEPLNVNQMNLPDAAKFALRIKYGNPVDVILSHSDLLYLEGLRDAGIKGIDTIIDAIEKYDEIAVKEKY